MIFGAHESIAGGVDLAIERGEQATCDAVQIFNKSNHQWKAKTLATDEIDRYFAAIERTGVRVACSHASYLINLASPDRTLSARSLRAFVTELKRCNQLAIPNLVFHPGSHVGTGAAAGMARVARNLNRALDQIPDNTVTLCLESTAGTGDNLGARFEELAEILDQIDDVEHAGICLDTCHLFAAGYGLVERRDYLATFRDFGRIVGFDRLRVFHVNDSKTPRGSRRDRHEHIGAGEIGLEGFRHLVNDRRLKRIPMLLETPKGKDLAEDRQNLSRLRGLVRPTARKPRKR